MHKNASGDFTELPPVVGLTALGEVPVISALDPSGVVGMRPTCALGYLTSNPLLPLLGATFGTGLSCVSRLLLGGLNILVDEGGVDPLKVRPLFTCEVFVVFYALQQ